MMYISEIVADLLRRENTQSVCITFADGTQIVIDEVKQAPLCDWIELHKCDGGSKFFNADKVVSIEQILNDETTKK